MSKRYKAKGRKLNGVDPVIERAKERLERMREMLDLTHERGELCQRFVAGEQWSEEDIARRERKGRPWLTVNKLATFINNVANKQAMLSFNINTTPFEDADRDKARIINGLLNHIQFSENSQATEAYHKSFRDLVETGIGALRVSSDYASWKSSDQDLIVGSIDDPFSVFMDPDRKYCLIVTPVNRDVYKETYGEEAGDDWDFGELQVHKNEDDVFVMEYWEIETEPVKVYKIEMQPELIPEAESMDASSVAAQMDSDTTDDSPIIRNVSEEELQGITQEYVVVSERDSEKISVKQYILCGDKILETHEFPGSRIPIVVMYGPKYIIDGKIFYKPLVWDAIGPQRLYNYYRSEEAELLGRHNKANWLGFEGVFKGHEIEFGDNANSIPYLQAKPTFVNGQLLPLPQRLEPPTPGVGLIQSMTQASDEIKASIGLFDPSLGNTSNEVSGKAILARTEQGDVATFHYAGVSFKGGLLQLGRIIVDTIPHYYDTARTVRILGEDMKDEVTRINESFIDPRSGKRKIYDLTVGEYDVNVDVGAPTMTRMMDEAENLINFVKVVPTAGQVIGDIVVKKISTDVGDEAAMRIRAALSPQILERSKAMEAEENGDVPPGSSQTQQMQQAIQQMQQAIQALGKENQALKGKVQQSALAEAQMKSQTDIMVAKIQAQAKAEVARISARGEIAEEQIKMGAGMPSPMVRMPDRITRQ